MATKKKLLQAAAGSAGGAGGLNVEDVFSTYLVTGTGSAYTVNNGIDLSGEGGLVWIKGRNLSGYNHTLYDTERSGTLFSDTTNAASDYASEIASYNNNGFTTVSSGAAFNNVNNTDYASWTFRKAPKFFTMVQWSGNSTMGRTISHDLGADVGFILIKAVDKADAWYALHKDSNMLVLNQTTAEYTNAVTADYFGDGTNIVRPTSTEFTVGSDAGINGTGYNYIAYLFAHNDGDGDFGPDGDADIVKCGSFTDSGSSSTPTDVDLGFEPQWLLVKASSTSSDWYLLDMMREMSWNDGRHLRPNISNAETNFSVGYFKPTPTGFQFRGDFFGSGQTAIYIAIRRGPMAVPESADDVFSVKTKGSAGDGVAPAYRSGFPVDAAIIRRGRNTTEETRILSRLTGVTYQRSYNTDAEASDGGYVMDFMNGWNIDTDTNTNRIAWMWKRAPNFFDVVAYTGNNTAGHAVPHNLGVTPEMVWVKERNDSVKWYVFMPSILGTTSALTLNDSNAPITVDSFTAYDETNLYFSGDGDVNGGGSPYIAYLFASLDGVSKVGSYTGSSSAQTIDCGFSSGARFVMIKNVTDSGTNWIIFDAERGIVSGNDPYLFLNANSAEDVNGSYDYLDPHSSGFTLEATNFFDTNDDGKTYIFYAVA